MDNESKGELSKNETDSRELRNKTVESVISGTLDLPDESSKANFGEMYMDYIFETQKKI